MARPRKFTPEQVADIRRLYARGLNMAGIAQLMGERYETVRRFLNEGYVDDPPTPGRRHMRGRPSKFTGSTLRLLHRRRAQGRSVTQLMAEFDAPRTTISQALRREPSGA